MKTAKSKKELQKTIANYSYDEATHALFANKGQIIDYKQELSENKKLLKVLFEGKTADHIKYIRDLEINLIKSKTTYKALKTNDELTQYQRTVKRKELKVHIKNIKKQIKLAKKFTNQDSYNEYVRLDKEIEGLKKNPVELEINNEILQVKKETLKNQALYKTKGLDKETYLTNKNKLTTKLNNLKEEVEKNKNNIVDNTKEIEILENKKLTVINDDKVIIDEEKVNQIKTKIDTLKNEIREFKTRVRYENKLLNRQRIKTLRYNNLAEEKKQIKQNVVLLKKKAKNKEELVNNNKKLTKEYKEKRGKVLKYQTNSLSYYFMLLVVLLEIIYVIIFLNKMYVSYMEFPTLIVNLVFILFLFLSAMKVKVYNKGWSIINLIFAVYLIIRIFVVIPFFAADRDPVYDETGKLITDAISYVGLRNILYGFSISMIVLIALSNIYSLFKIKERNAHLN